MELRKPFSLTRRELLQTASAVVAGTALSASAASAAGEPAPLRRLSEGWEHYRGNLGDTVVTGWFHKVGGPLGGGYGLILRDQNPDQRDGRNQLGRYYVFEVGDRGEVGVWLRDVDHWVDLLTWTPSDAVKPGFASNELTVTAAGDHMSFVVNGPSCPEPIAR